jgi:hypothetical protein
MVCCGVYVSVLTFFKDLTLTDATLRDELVMASALIKRTNQLLDFTYSEAASKLLQLESVDDHSGQVALLQKERDSRVELVRELDRLAEQKQKLEVLCSLFVETNFKS